MKIIVIKINFRNNNNIIIFMQGLVEGADHSMLAHVDMGCM